MRVDLFKEIFTFFACIPLEMTHILVSFWIKVFELYRYKLLRINYSKRGKKCPYGQDLTTRVRERKKRAKTNVRPLPHHVK